MNCSLIPYMTKRESLERKRRKTPHFYPITCELHEVKKGNDGNYYKIVKSGITNSKKKWKLCGKTEDSCKSVCSKNYTYNQNKCNKNASKKNGVFKKLKNMVTSTKNGKKKKGKGKNNRSTNINESQ